MQSFAENAAIAGNSPAGGAEIKSQWQNKRIAFLGDSITDKCHVGTTKNYWQYLEEILGIKPAVYGINGDKIETVGEVPTDILGVDRNQITSINAQLVKNRKRIAYNGSVFITAVLDADWKPEYLDISSIDILEEEAWTTLAEEIRADMLKAIPEEVIKLNHRESAVKEYISAKIRKRIYNRTGIKPVVFMHFHKKEAEI